MSCDACVQMASAIQQSKVQNQVSVAIAKKSMDVQKQQGQAAVELIQQVSDLVAQLNRGQIDQQI